MPPARPAETDKRAAILDAALQLFVQRGFHGTAVPELAKLAGVGAGTIYRYFENKEAIVNALYCEWKPRISGFVISGLPIGGTAREAFHAVFVRLTQFVSEHPQVYAFLELHHHAPYLDEASRATEQQVYDFAHAFVLSAQARGALRMGPPAVLMALLHGAFVGFVRFKNEGRLSWNDEELAVAEDALWRLVAAD